MLRHMSYCSSVSYMSAECIRRKNRRIINCMEGKRYVEGKSDNYLLSVGWILADLL